MQSALFHLLREPVYKDDSVQLMLGTLYETTMRAVSAEYKRLMLAHPDKGKLAAYTISKGELEPEMHDLCKSLWEQAVDNVAKTM